MQPRIVMRVFQRRHACFDDSPLPNGFPDSACGAVTGTVSDTHQTPANRCVRVIFARLRTRVRRGRYAAGLSPSWAGRRGTRASLPCCSVVASFLVAVIQLRMHCSPPRLEEEEDACWRMLFRLYFGIIGQSKPFRWGVPDGVVGERVREGCSGAYEAVVHSS